MREGEDRGWIRTTAIIWLAVLTAMMGMSLVMPFLPLYLRELGVAERDAPLWAGWIGGANFLCAALVAPFWGHLADRYGRKPMAVRALVGLAVSVGLMGFARNHWHLFFLRMLQGSFGGFVSAAIALVAACVPRERLGAMLGLVQSAVVTGHLIGPLVGGELSHHFGYRSTFRITGLLLVAAMLLILFLVREQPTAREEKESAGALGGLRELLGVPALRWTLTCVLLTHAGIMLINPQISLFVRELVEHEAAVNRVAGFVTAAPALSSFLAAPLWGRAGDRAGHARVLQLALLGAGLSIPWAGLAGAWQHLFLVRFAMGSFTAALNPAAHSTAAHAVDQHRTARAFSLLSSAHMLGACLGPFLGGPLAFAVGLRWLFPITSVVLLAAGLAALRAGRAGR